MRRAPTCRLAVLAGACGVVLAGGAAPAGAAVLKRCDGPSWIPDRCGRVTVPLDRTGRVAGTIELRVRVRGTDPAASTVLALADEPGPPGTALLGDVDVELGPLLGRNGRLVTFDQRGTGGSGPIACRALDREPDPAQAAADCAAELGPARASYTTAERIADVEAVRVALGVERMTVYGVGSGARLGFAYASAHPERVTRLVLDSPVPPEGVDPFRRATLRALPRVLRASCRWSCPPAADPSGELAALVRRAEQAPLPARAIDGRGRAHAVSIGPPELLRLVLASERNRYVGSYLPTAVHAALRGDPALLARLVDMPSGASDWRALGASLLARTCEDGPVPWTPGASLTARRAAVDALAARVPAAALAPFGLDAVRGLGFADVCVGWPDAPIVQPQAPLPPVPTLILAGQLDLQTPPSGTVALARRIPTAQLVRVPGIGHDVVRSADMFDGCVDEVLTAFAQRGAAGPCRVERFAGPRDPRPRRWWYLPPSSFAAVRSAGRRLPPRVGRTLTAVRLTLYDVMQQVDERMALSGGTWRDLRYGGLRAGYADFGARRWSLRRYSYIPGVTVSVGVSPRRPRRPLLVIEGSAAVHGRLSRTAPCGESSCFVGRLAGHRVHVLIPGSA